MAISAALRRFVFDRARERCEYCQIEGWPLTVDHVVPVVAWKAARRGQDPPPFDPDSPENLAAACAPCNRAKWNAITGHDVLTDQLTRLFNPRTDHWDDHFAWVEDYEEVVGLTPIGRGTAARLRLNRPIYRQQRRRL